MIFTATKSHYRSPTREAYAEVSLREFSADEMRAEIANREGGKCHHLGDEYTISSGIMARLSTLVLCGQRDAALQELCRELEPFVGRSLP